MPTELLDLPNDLGLVILLSLKYPIGFLSVWRWATISATMSTPEERYSISMANKSLWRDSCELKRSKFVKLGVFSDPG